MSEHGSKANEFARSLYNLECQRRGYYNATNKKPSGARSSRKLKRRRTAYNKEMDKRFARIYKKVAGAGESVLCVRDEALRMLSECQGD